jgi:hypothetical protein
MGTIFILAEFFPVVIFLSDFRNLKRDILAIIFVALSVVGGICDLIYQYVLVDLPRIFTLIQLNCYTFLEIFFLVLGALIIVKHRMAKIFLVLFVVISATRTYYVNIVTQSSYSDVLLAKVEFCVFLIIFIYWIVKARSEPKMYLNRWFWFYFGCLFSLFFFLLLTFYTEFEFENIKVFATLNQASIYIRSILVAIGLAINAKEISHSSTIDKLS